MSDLSNEILILKKLTIDDSKAFYNIYSTKEFDKNFESPIETNEDPIEFTQKIIEKCDFIWSIRYKNNPEKIIGDCALHHWDKENKTIEIGGSLLPEYWGKGIMIQSLNLVMDFSINFLNVKSIIGKTEKQNHQAIKMIEKLGFKEKQNEEENQIVLVKIIDVRAY